MDMYNDNGEIHKHVSRCTYFHTHAIYYGLYQILLL